MNIAERIKKIRGELKLTQEKMAEKTGISKSFIGNVESDKQTPSFDFLITLCEKLDISADYLLFGKGQMFREDNEFFKNIDPNWLGTLKDIENFDIDTKLSFMELVIKALETIKKIKIKGV